jgi:hypothetical protein
MPDLGDVESCQYSFIYQVIAIDEEMPHGGPGTSKGDQIMRIRLRGCKELRAASVEHQNIRRFARLETARSAV